MNEDFWAAKEAHLTAWKARAAALAPAIVEARKVMRQALDALEYHRDQTRPIDRTDAAIEALRAQLEPKP